MAVVFFVLVIMACLAYRCHVIDRPVFAVAVTSSSMEPTIRRGDVVFIRPVRSDTHLCVNQIILFKSEENRIHHWTMHRIVGGCVKHGFLTRGDSNHCADQHVLGYPEVKREWIGGVVPHIGNTPLKLPYLGYVTLFIHERSQASPFMTGLLINGAFVMLLSLILFGARCWKKRWS